MARGGYWVAARRAVLHWVRPADETSELDLDLEGLGMIFGNDDAD